MFHFQCFEGHYRGHPEDEGVVLVSTTLEAAHTAAAAEQPQLQPRNSLSLEDTLGKFRRNLGNMYLDFSV